MSVLGDPADGVRRLRPGDGPGGRNGGRGGSDPLELVLTAVARGDNAAFRTLYDQVSPAVLGTVLRVLRDPAQSEEVMQEVLLEIWRTAARFDPSAGSPAAWIMTVSSS